MIQPVGFVIFYISFRRCKCLPPKFPDNCQGKDDHTCTNSKQCGKRGVCTKFYGGTGKKYAFQDFFNNKPGIIFVKHLHTHKLLILTDKLQSNLVIRNFLVTLKWFLKAKCSLWSRWWVPKLATMLHSMLRQNQKKHI